MSDLPLPGDTPPADGPPSVPWGHSVAAHRVLGWCSHCPGHGPAEEVVAWRARENKRHEAEQAALAVSAANTNPVIDLAATYERPCRGCGRETLTAVTVTLVGDGPRRVVGGWAYCTECDATPYQAMDDADLEPSELPFFVDSSIRREHCPECRRDEDTLLVSTFTATTRTGAHTIGGWSYCLQCQATPGVKEARRA